MTRPNLIGRNQGRALSLLVMMAPRPVDTRVLAHVLDSAGDQTRGRRAIKVLEERGLIERAPLSALQGPRSPERWAATTVGRLVWLTWIPSYVDKVASWDVSA